MAILRGFPPSNTISIGTWVADLHGDAVVIDNKDPQERGRVKLWPLNEWANQKWGMKDGLFPIPPVDTKVRWSAKSYSKSEGFHYDWEEGWKETHKECKRKADEGHKKWKKEHKEKKERERINALKEKLARKDKQCF
jgi:hypothetical protein